MIASLRRQMRGGWLHREVRGFQQERLAARELAHYQALARSRRLAPQTDAETFQALRQRVNFRNGGRWPKPKGELEVFVACSVTNWESVLADAFGVFGRVTHFDWRALGFDEGSSDWPSQLRPMNEALLRAFRDANDVKPFDVVVACLSGQTAHRNTVTTLAASGACVLNFCWDDKLGFRGKEVSGRLGGPAHIVPEVDLSLTNAPSSVVKYQCEGGLAVFCPEAAVPPLESEADPQFAYDVSFIGQRYGRRGAFVESLQRRGFQVECFGAGWPRGPIASEEMSGVYRRSRINLGFAGVGFARNLYCLKGRDFEVQMAGGLYLTEANPELDLVYRVGEEIETYRDAEDCATKITSLLSDPAGAHRIRSAGRKRALREHTYEARWGRVFRECGLMQPE